MQDNIVANTLASLAAQKKLFQDAIIDIEAVEKRLGSSASPPPQRGRPKAHTAGSATKPKKRKLSPESRQRIVDATKRRWAAKRQGAAVQAANGAEAIA